MVNIDAREVRRLALDLAKAPIGVQRRTTGAIRKTALDIERDAKILVPVDTGNLKNSLSSDIAAFHAEIGPTAEYGGYVEEGTSRMSPQPYLRPAFDRNAPGLEQSIGRAGEDIL